MKKNLLEVSFTDLPLNGCLDKVKAHLKSDSEKAFHIITANPEIVMEMRRNSVMKAIGEDSDMIIADGIGIIWGSKILGSGIKNKVTGIEMLEGLLSMCEAEKHSIYFLGAKEAVNKAMSDYAMIHYPDLNIAGRSNGYFDKDGETTIIEDIQKKSPDVLFMGMGSPRAQEWFSHNEADLPVKVAMDVGGGFDALTGHVKRAPVWIQKANVEWLYRRLQNPSRAERQKDLYRFAGLVFKKKFSAF